MQMREDLYDSRVIIHGYWYHDGSLYDHPLTWLLACVVGSFGNADTLSTFILHKHTRDPCLINLVAGNIIAMMCLPFNYLQHFSPHWDLGYSWYTVFWISRDIATSLQIYSLAIFSVLRYFKLKHPDSLYESVPNSDPIYYIQESAVIAKSKRRIPKISAITQTSLIWVLAVMYAAPSAIFSETYSAIQRRKYEDINSSAIFHSLVFCFLPLILTLVFYVMTEYHNYKVPSRNSTKHSQEGRLVLWLSIVIFINYVPFYAWILYAWTNQFQLLSTFLDFATYFPLYSTACWIPVVMFFATYKSLEKHATQKCSSKNEKGNNTTCVKNTASVLTGDQNRTNQIILSVPSSPK
ncbi:gastrin-releasing peptide receptor-like isoform X2 [Periplaneta americana]|uniref:gastrin-releasing peptide receptor-like isoform X2 n=1 Tax=Periplaneta americana TaxID=6978 RepID=UPI0037E72C27